VIRVTRSQPAPASLAKQKSWRTEEVVARLRADFRNKCYLCEEPKISKVEVDHLHPPGDDRDLEFHWNNLFYCCGHCNGTKSDTFWPVLDCTDHAVPVLSLLRYSYEVREDLRAAVVVESSSEDLPARTTAALLTKIFDGRSPTRGVESANIVEKMLEQSRNFFRVVRDLATGNGSEKERARWHKRISRELAPETGFTAIRAWQVIERGLADEFRTELERLGYAFSE
jgi:hypothetical protein